MGISDEDAMGVVNELAMTKAIAMFALGMAVRLSVDVAVESADLGDDVEKINDLRCAVLPVLAKETSNSIKEAVKAAYRKEAEESLPAPIANVVIGEMLKGLDGRIEAIHDFLVQGMNPATIRERGESFIAKIERGEL